MRTVVAVVIALALCSLVLAGCGKSEPGQAQAKTPTQSLPQISTPVQTPPQPRVPSSAIANPPAAMQPGGAQAQGDRWFQQQVADQQRQQAQAQQAEAREWQEAQQAAQEREQAIRDPESHREAMVARAAEMERQRILAAPLCNLCEGKGWHDCSVCVNGVTNSGRICSACLGRGWVICTWCNGTGHYLE